MARTMRVAVGGIFHESNTFVQAKTTLDDVYSSPYHRGEALLTHWADTNNEIAGFIDLAHERKIELVPTTMAWIMPSGMVESNVYDRLSREIFDDLNGAGELDGVLLLQHGAWVTDEQPCADGFFLSELRRRMGTELPIVTTLDFHANLDPSMVLSTDAAVGYRTYPHIDQRQTGYRAAAILADTIEGRVKPTMALSHPPIMVNIMRQLTCDPGPMAEVMELVVEAESRPGVLSATVFGGFAYSDVPHVGSSAVVITDDDQALAQSIAEELAETIWSRRQRFAKPLPKASKAVAMAIDEDHGPVVLADTGDNVGGGSPGDGTVLLAELIMQKAENALVLICDPDAVNLAIEAGVRSKVSLMVGGKNDRLHGEPVEISGVVRLISDGRWTNLGDMHDGVEEDQGRTVVVELEGVVLVLSERKHYMWNLEQLRSLGIAPERLGIVVNKSAIAHRAAYGPIASRMTEVATPGVCPVDLSTLTYKNIRRPIYPLDEI